MPKDEYRYKCDVCGKKVVFKKKLPAMQKQKCDTLPYCIGVLRLDNGYGGILKSFDQTIRDQVKYNEHKPPKPPSTTSVNGRCPSAPPVSTVTMPAHGKTIVTTLTDPAWTSATKSQVKLAYFRLDGANDSMQGLIQNCLDIVGYLVTWGGQAQALLDHFTEITAAMVKNHRLEEVTECTGEAAAAIGVLDKYGSQYRMLWGFGQHSGAGIDQIWGKPNPNAGQPGEPDFSDYLIVEAKGVGQVLASKNYVPPDIQDQMSKGWIVNNIERMVGNTGDAIARGIKDDIGLDIRVTWPNYNGASKSYYGLPSGWGGKTGKATLHAQVYTAEWTSTGLLSYQFKDLGQYF